MNIKWNKFAISAIGDVVGGGTPSTKHDEYYGDEISWITPKDLSNFNGRYISRGERSISQKGYDNSSAQKLPAGTVLFSSRAPIGYVAIAQNELCTNQGFKSVIPHPDVCDSEFLYYLLCYHKYDIEAIASGTTFMEVSGTALKNFIVRIPDIDTQKKIASVLSSLDRRIESNNLINHNLEEQAKAIFKSWFVDFEPFGYRTPCDWEIGTLGDFVEIKRGGSPRPIQDYLSDCGLRWLKISDATACSSPFIIDIKEHIKESGLSKTVLLRAGSLVLSNSATPGIPKFLDVDSCIHDGWLYFPMSKLSNEFLFLFFKHIRPNLVSLGNGSVFTNLKTDILKAYPFILPDEQTLSAFNDMVVPVFDRIKNNSRETNNLAKLRETLLPKLMAGEIDISEVEI